MSKVLHVGCGSHTLRNLPPLFQDGSWSEIRLDIDPDVQPDVTGSMTDMAAIETGSVQAVFSSHNIEHLFPHEVPVALAEFRRVLSPDGFVLITCPDLQSVAQLVAEDKLLEPAYQSGVGPIAPLDILYGHRASIAQGRHYMAHRGGFTARSLVDALTSAGFAGLVVRRVLPAFALWALAALNPWSEDDLKRYAAQSFPG